MWCVQLLREIGIELPDISTIKTDNQGALRLAHNPEISKRTKHIDVHFHFIRRLVQEKSIKIEYIESPNQLADSLTKSVSYPRLETMLIQLGIRGAPKEVVALCLLVVAGVSSLEPINPTILMHSTDHKVSEGVKIAVVQYTTVMLCDWDMTGSEHNSPHDVSRMAVSSMSEQCKKAYKELIPSAMRRLGKCQRNQLRTKRELIMIGVISAAILGASAVGSGGTALYSYLAAGSSYTRLNVKDELDKNHTQEIEELKRQVIAQQLHLDTAREVRGRTIDTLNDFGLEIGNNTAAIKHLAKYGAYLAWRGSAYLSNLKTMWPTSQR